MLTRRIQLILLMLSLALWACTGARCSGEGPGSKTPHGATTPKPRPDLRLLLLTDPKGYLEPCGCQLRPLGGVDKLAHVVSEARKDGVPTLLLAAGDLTFGTELRPEDRASAADQESWRAETLVNIWNQVGLAAAAPGKLDLVQPPEQRQALIEASHFPWLVSNLQMPADRQSPFQVEGKLLTAGAWKVGVLGLVAPDAAVQLPDGATLDEELARVAKQGAEQLRAQGAKLVVALVNGERRSARSLAGKGPDVVVMGGLDLEQPLPPALHEGTIFVHAGRQGQRVVSLDLKLAAQGPVQDASDWSKRENERALKQQVGELRSKIAEWEKAKNVAEKDLAAQRARLRELERSLEEPKPLTYQGRWFSAEAIELAPEVPVDQQVAEQMDAYDRRVNEHNKRTLADRLPVPAKEGAPTYAGSESCKSCHEAAYTWWRNTKHGRAYATLERVHKEFNLNCVGCHVTGYNQPGGSTVTHVENLKDVGCESCHGPGSQHNQEPDKRGLMVRDTPEAVCVGCHTQEHSDRFQYEAFKSLLRVPGHGLPAQKAK